MALPGAEGTPARHWTRAGRTQTELGRSSEGSRLRTTRTEATGWDGAPQRGPRGLGAAHRRAAERGSLQRQVGGQPGTPGLVTPRAAGEEQEIPRPLEKDPPESRDALEQPAGL